MTEETTNRAAIEGIFNVADLGPCLFLRNGIALYFGPKDTIHLDNKLVYLRRGGEIIPLSISVGADNKALVYSAFGNIDYDQYEICYWGGRKNTTAKIILDRRTRKYILKTSPAEHVKIVTRDNEE